MEVKKIVEGMTAVEVAEVIDSNFKAQNKIIEDRLKELDNELDKVDMSEVVSKNYVPTRASYRTKIGVVLKAGVTYLVEVAYNSPTGKFAHLRANYGNEGVAPDVLLKDVYLNNGSVLVEYTPSIDVNTWYIEMASDYVATDTTSIEIRVYQNINVAEVLGRVETLESDVDELKKKLEESGENVELLSDKNIVPTILSGRYSIGTILRAGKTYTIQLDYYVSVGFFVGLKAHTSNSGEPVDTIKYDLYNNKGSFTIEYTPSVDVNTWYVYMASNFEYSDQTYVSIKVYGEPEESEVNIVQGVKRLGVFDFNLESKGSKSLSTNYARGKSMTCVDIDAAGNFESIRMDYDGYASVDINGSSIVVNYKNGSTIEHGLPLSTAERIAVSFERKTATQLVVRIIADGHVFVSQGISFFVFGGAKLINNGSKSIHISSLTYCPSLIDNDVWVIGDSYVSAADPNRWPYWIEQWGHGDVYIDGLSGGSSAVMYSSLLADLEMYTPKYIIWCLGMNNADSDTAVNGSWLDYVMKVVKLCEDRGIVPILATIPSVPTRNNSYKNEWVRNHEYRYVDFARAVEDVSNTGYWYDGMLSDDGVHPSEEGAKALAMQMMIDFVEITTK